MKQILVADDSVIVRQLLSLYLMKYIHCEISEARDGMEALEKLGQDTFDLLITDLNMPRMHGLALVRAVREKFGPRLPVVVVTTKGGERDRDRALRLGADGYVTKPVRAAGFVKIVTELLSREVRGESGEAGGARASRPGREDW